MKILVFLKSKWMESTIFGTYLSHYKSIEVTTPSSFTSSTMSISLPFKIMSEGNWYFLVLLKIITFVLGMPSKKTSPGGLRDAILH